MLLQRWTRGSRLLISRCLSSSSCYHSVRSSQEVYGEPPPRSLTVPLRVYVNPFCPFAQRARLLVAAKSILHDSVFIHLERRPPWFLRLNPNGLVPVIDHNGRVVRESEICFDYLDEVFNNTPLWPSDPFRKAKQKILLSDFNSKFLGGWFRYRGGDSSPTILTAISSVLSSMEAMIQEAQGAFLSGGECGAIDLLLWPFFERLRPTAAVKPEINTDFSEANFPVLTQWMRMMEEVEAVRSVLLPFEVHVKLAKALAEKQSVDYSLADIDGNGITVYAAPSPFPT